MTRDDIIRMAREAGIIVSRVVDNVAWATDLPDLERFAAMVAAAEREACAKMCDPQLGIKYSPNTLDAHNRLASAIRDRK